MKYKFLILTLIYAGGILWFSLQPDAVGGEEVSSLRIIFRNFLHVPAYAGLAGLLMLTVEGSRIKDQGLGNNNGRDKIKPGWFFSFSSFILQPSSLVFVIATSYGVLNEFVQAGVPGRFFSIGDMILNAVGTGIGIWVIQKFRRMED